MRHCSRLEAFPMDESTLTRRGSLLRLGGFLVTALGAAGLKIETSEGAGPAAVASGAVSCVLTPEQTEGPYYIAGEKLRRNITEGRPGAPLLLRAFVVDASTCKAIKNGNVDHTGQLYFPDTLTDAVYRKAPYSSRPSRETRNANDSVYRNGGSKSLIRIRKNSAGVYVATITMGVHRS